MTNNLCQFSFSIQDWKIITSKNLSLDDFTKLSHINFSEREDYKPKLSFLPPLKRRRLSKITRLFFEAAWELVDNNPNIPVVYASTKSEINRSFSLWQDLLEEGIVSPTSFSLSVHNALIGQWSENRKIKQEMTAITATADNLEIALMEAYLMLNDGYQQVLVAICESQIDEQFHPIYCDNLPFDYALVILVTTGSDITLTLNSTPLSPPNPFDNSLTYVINQYSDIHQWYSSSHKGQWIWQKN